MSRTPPRPSRRRAAHLALAAAVLIAAACMRERPAPVPVRAPVPTPIPVPPPEVPDTGRSGPAWRAFAEGRTPLAEFERFAPAAEPIAPSALDGEILSATVFYCTNLERTRNGRGALAWSAPLGRAAARYSADMAAQGFFSHTHPSDASRRTFVDRLRAEGVPLSYAAENIAHWHVAAGDTYLSFARRIVTSWMNSATHRTNILNRNYTSLGVGVSETGGSGGMVYATQEFSAGEHPER